MSIPTPIKNIGCQELIESGMLKQHGHLRRRGIMNKLVDKVTINIKWKRNYTLLYKGCLYFYADETNLSYTKALSLYGFNNCIDCANGEYPTFPSWAFRVNNAINENKSIYLSAVSDEEKKKWIKSITNEILAVNRLERKVILPNPCEPGTDSDSDYEEVEEEGIKPTPQKSMSRVKPKPPPILHLENKNTILSKNGNFRSSLFPPPAINLKPDKVPNVTLSKFPPKVLPKPKPVSLVSPTIRKYSNVTAPSFHSPEYELNEPNGFWNKDPLEGERFLISKDLGTFLLRSSKATIHHPLTLLVKTEGETLKKYQILKTNDKYHLERDSKEEERFVYVNLLISYYQKHRLPSKGKPILLKHPYDSRPVNNNK